MTRATHDWTDDAWQGCVKLRARYTVAIAAVAALLGLSACNGPAEPKPLEKQSDEGGAAVDGKETPDGKGSTPTSDETPSDDGTGGGPVQRGQYEPVDAKTEAEVTAAALRFTKEYDKLLATGDSSAVEGLYTDDCTKCGRNLGNVKKVYQRGGRYDGGAFLDPKVEVRGRESDGRVFAAVIGKSSAYKVLDSSGKVVESVPEQQDNQRYWFEKTADGWQLVSWT